MKRRRADRSTRAARALSLQALQTPNGGGGDVAYDLDRVTQYNGIENASFSRPKQD